jgi:hypothetical protein
MYKNEEWLHQCESIQSHSSYPKPFEVGKRFNMDKELLARIDERQQGMQTSQQVMEKTLTEKLELIYSEVKKTNGRVTKLEGWRNRTTGIWAALLILGTIIGALVNWIIQLITS